MSSTVCPHPRPSPKTSGSQAVPLLSIAKAENPTAQLDSTPDYRSVNTLPPKLDWPICLAKREPVLGLVGLLTARAHEIFNSLRRLGALSLLEFADPVCNGIHHVVRCFANDFGLAFLPLYALGAFDDFYFLL